jgi:hypothetical protein
MNATNITNSNTWMTGIYEHIKNLRVHQLALPSAHNSGMDKGILGPIGGNWAACQDYFFGTQLRQGARVLDLRIKDYSYKKDIGGSKVPRYKFFEDFKCEHLLPGRNLDQCLADVRRFAESNPGELIILDIHKFDRGRNLNDSTGRFKNKLSQLNHLLIPPTARNFSLAEIKKKHPSRNVIICWGGGTYWNTIYHIWAGDKKSRAQLESFIINEARKKVSSTAFSSLSATIYDAGGPMRLGRGEKVWTEVFHAQHSVFNIINVDFLQDTGIVEKCVALNKERGQAAN